RFFPHFAISVSHNKISRSSPTEASVWPSLKKAALHTPALWPGNVAIRWRGMSSRLEPRVASRRLRGLVPDGARVTFQSDREGDLGIFWQRADGSGAMERLTKPEQGVAHVPDSWSKKWREPVIHRDQRLSFLDVRAPLVIIAPQIRKHI